jgi:hypothetical protein
MAGQKRKKTEHDAAVTAFRVFQKAVDESEEEEETPATKRGKARAAKLTPETRSEIARRAARARWDKAR